MTPSHRLFLAVSAALTSLSSRGKVRRLLVAVVLLNAGLLARAAEQSHYYAHDAVEDHYGVIAPWYTGQNGQFDERIQVAAETLKRYPWLDRSRSEARAPEYLLSSFWKISPDGAISTPPLNNWMNGDRGQLAAYVLREMPLYYRYSGDPTTLAHAKLEADLFLRYALTPADHPWPNFPITVPVRGKPYGTCSPDGFMQLDLVGQVGFGLLQTYQLTGDRRYFEAVKHWADVLAQKRDHTPGACPWTRYANYGQVDMRSRSNVMGGSIVWLLQMFDELIRLGYTGENGAVLEARKAGRDYLRDVLLPAWTTDDTWGHDYWDWACAVQLPNVTALVARYMMDHKEWFPNWKNDCRNILALCFNNTCLSPASMGDVYSGAWATPESRACCERCLTAGPQLTGLAWARYAVEADSEWAREIARRQMILMTYDFRESGVCEDNIDGGGVTVAEWFEAAHLSPLDTMLGVMAWMPETFGPSRENHIMRSSSVVNRVTYAAGRIEYSTFDAPEGTVDVLRLAYKPAAVMADGRRLNPITGLEKNGYTLQRLQDGDWIVHIRHDGSRSVAVTGEDPQQTAAAQALVRSGPWSEAKAIGAGGETTETANVKGASATMAFTGNQVRLVGTADARGGLADVYIDGKKQLCGVDSWSPVEIHRQILFTKRGLANRTHEIKVVVRGEGNPLSQGTRVGLDAVQWSAASGAGNWGEGGGPTGPQRLIFGYTGRKDYVDGQGHAWRPGCEFVIRTETRGAISAVQASWWTDPALAVPANTKDPELYRYGIHGKEFAVKLTVGPGKYHTCLKFAANREPGTPGGFTLLINGRVVAERMDVEAAARGRNRAFDLTFDDVTPKNGTIEFQFRGAAVDKEGKPQSEAFVQAIEIAPSPL